MSAFQPKKVPALPRSKEMALVIQSLVDLKRAYELLHQRVIALETPADPPTIQPIEIRYEPSEA